MFLYTLIWLSLLSVRFYLGLYYTADAINTTVLTVIIYSMVVTQYLYFVLISDFIVSRKSLFLLPLLAIFLVSQEVRHFIFLIFAALVLSRLPLIKVVKLTLASFVAPVFIFLVTVAPYKYATKETYFKGEVYTFGFANPNSFALWVLSIFIVLALYLIINKRYVLFYLVSFFLFSMYFFTLSKTAILSTATFVFLVVFYRFFNGVFYRFLAFSFLALVVFQVFYSFIPYPQELDLATSYRFHFYSKEIAKMSGFDYFFGLSQPITPPLDSSFIMYLLIGGFPVLLLFSYVIYSYLISQSVRKANQSREHMLYFCFVYAILLSSFFENYLIATSPMVLLFFRIVLFEKFSPAPIGSNSL